MCDKNLADLLERACDARDDDVDTYGINDWRVSWWSGYIAAVEGLAGV